MPGREVACCPGSASSGRPGLWQPLSFWLGQRRTGSTYTSSPYREEPSTTCTVGCQSSARCRRHRGSRVLLPHLGSLPNFGRRHQQSWASALSRGDVLVPSPHPSLCLPFLPRPFPPLPCALFPAPFPPSPVLVPSPSPSWCPPSRHRGASLSGGVPQCRHRTSCHSPASSGSLWYFSPSHDRGVPEPLLPWSSDIMRRLRDCACCRSASLRS